LRGWKSYCRLLPDALGAAGSGSVDSAQNAIPDLEAVETEPGAVCSGYANGNIGLTLRLKTAGSPHGPWRIANSPALSLAFPIASFDALGLPRLLDVV